MYLKCIHPPPPHHNLYKDSHELITHCEILFSFAWAKIQAKAKKSSKFIFIHEI